MICGLLAGCRSGHEGAWRELVQRYRRLVYSVPRRYGLDRDAGAGLGGEVERLHKSCRRLVWLNPLLRYEGFEPRALGMQAILPHVDELRAVHNLDSLEALVGALGAPGPRHEEGVTRWLNATH